MLETSDKLFIRMSANEKAMGFTKSGKPWLSHISFFCVIAGAGNCGKPRSPSDDHIILAERTVDDEQVSAFISAPYDPHMLIAGIEHQITRLSLIPRDGGAVGVLVMGTATVPYDVLASGDIIKYPVHESTAIEPVRKIGPGGGATVRPYLGELAPAGVPANHQGLHSDR